MEALRQITIYELTSKQAFLTKLLIHLYLSLSRLQVNSFVGAFHDAVILYALALNETLAAGYNATDGAEITKRMWNRSFEGKYNSPSLLNTLTPSSS